MFRSVAPEGKHAERSDRMKNLGIALLMTVVFAAAIATAIFVSIHNGRDAPRKGPDGIKLTADEATGRELFAKTCSTCHTLMAVNAVGRIGPDLDVLKPSKAFVLYAIKNGFAQGQGQMPAGIYTGQYASDVASFVAAVAGH
jgi:mono/diheme cytochrome c family protein